VGGIEPFLDETGAFIENLKKSGVPVDFKVFDGCFHAFDQMCKDTDISRLATAFLMESYDYAVHHYRT
jgi:acetyl esterase/lipase